MYIAFVSGYNYYNITKVKEINRNETIMQVMYNIMYVQFNSFNHVPFESNDLAKIIIIIVFVLFVTNKWSMYIS